MTHGSFKLSAGTIRLKSHIQCGSGSGYVANDAVTLKAAKLYLGWLHGAVTRCCAGFDHACYMTIIFIDVAFAENGMGIAYLSLSTWCYMPQVERKATPHAREGSNLFGLEVSVHSGQTLRCEASCSVATDGVRQ